FSGLAKYSTHFNSLWNKGFRLGCQRLCHLATPPEMKLANEGVRRLSSEFDVFEKDPSFGTGGGTACTRPKGIRPALVRGGTNFSSPKHLMSLRLRRFIPLRLRDTPVGRGMA